MTKTTLFSKYGWTVAGNEDDNYDIIDHEGDVVDEATTLRDAIKSCSQHAIDSYRERLTEAIQNADTEEVAIQNLRRIVRMLGINPDTL